MSNYIKHHGIKGQKWGVRRFQNKDGSLTAAGRKRYDDELKGAKAVLDKSNEVIGKGKTVSNELGKIAQNEFDKKYNERLKKSVSEMSDKELREVVNRLNMEENYMRIMQTRAPKIGKSKVDEILDYAGVALTISSSALGIALAIRELKAKK